MPGVGAAHGGFNQPDGHCPPTVDRTSTARCPRHQLAWVRQADSLQIAAVELTAHSGNQRSSLTATRWRPPEAIRA